MTSVDALILSAASDVVDSAEGVHMAEHQRLAEDLGYCCWAGAVAAPDECPWHPPRRRGLTAAAHAMGLALVAVATVAAFVLVALALA